MCAHIRAYINQNCSSCWLNEAPPGSNTHTKSTAAYSVIEKHGEMQQSLSGDDNISAQILYVVNEEINETDN